MFDRFEKTILSLLLVMGALLSSGCSQQKEVEQLAIVGALAFDKVTENGRDEYQASVIIYKPIEMGGGESGGGGGKSGSPYLSISAKGTSLDDAQKNLTIYSSRSILYSHAELLIVGERLFREDGIDKVLDLTIRSRDIRLQTHILVAKGQAVDILAIRPWQEPSLSKEIVRDIESLKNESTSYVPDLKEFVQCSLSPGRDPLLGKIQIQSLPEELLVGKGKGTDTLNLIGAAVISQKKLAGWLNEEEVKGFHFVVNRIERATILVKLPGKQESFSCQVIKAKTDIVPQIQDDELSVSLEVNVELRVLAIEGKETISNQSETEKLNELVADEIKRIIESSIQKSQELKSDIFGFGNAVHRKYLKEWQETEDNWKDIYPELATDVSVKAKIRLPGMISSPIEVK